MGNVGGRLSEEGSGISLSAGQVTGLAATMYVLGACLGALFFGWLTDRLGRKKLFLVTLAVYLVATGLTAFSMTPLWFFACRFLAGFGIGGEYAAINSAIDELIPSRVRGRVDLAINGSFWFGAMLGALLSVVALNESIFAANVGWRLTFGLGVVLGSVILLVRRHVPESPRWLFIHGREEEANAIVEDIERQVRESTGQELSEVHDTITIRQRRTIGFDEIAKVMVKLYPKRTTLGMSLFIGQAFLYNAITFGYATILIDYFDVPSARTGYYYAVIAIGNFAGPVLTGHLFDTIGRRKMIAGTYILSGIFLLVTAQLFRMDILNAVSVTACWTVVLFFASCGASSAYLTVSEVFPMETRALAIAFFYAIGTAIGGDHRAPAVLSADRDRGRRPGRPGVRDRRGADDRRGAGRGGARRRRGGQVARVDRRAADGGGRVRGCGCGSNYRDGMTAPAAVAPPAPAGTAHLFSPLTIRGVTLANRIGVSPMCQYTCGPDGLATDWHLVHLGARAVGGAGLVISEAAAVAAEGRISPQDLGIWTEEQARALEPITRFIAAQGAVPGIQLAHAGRKASTFRPWDGHGRVEIEDGGWEPFGPSASAYSDDHAAPRELDEDGLRAIVEAFAAAARRSLDAGFRWLEVHAAHGYLLHSFLSPLSNTRTDAYGGDLAGRARLLVEVVEAVRAEAGDEIPVSVRVSATDWVQGGWSDTDTVALAPLLADAGADLVDVSSGGNSPAQQITVGPGYQVPFAQAVREQAGVLTSAVGMITEPAQADAIVREGQADVVLLARELLRDPHWPLRAAQELGADAPVPPQYARAY